MIDDPTIKSWGFTLDGHDFYLIRLGHEGKTLVYDVSTGQWAWWCTDGRSSFRVQEGKNWVSSGGLAGAYGSNIIAGDDTTGDLWVLDPDSFLDDELPFTREATAQMITEGRKPLQIYSVYLTSSIGDPDVEDNIVTLSYSDDLGHTYITADAPQVSISEYDQEFAWRSLGQATAPGRLFKLRDTGSFARINVLHVNEE